MAQKKYECEKCERTFKTEEGCEVHEEHCKGKEHKREKESKKSGGGGVVLLVLLIIAVVVWGFIGGSVAQEVGVSCDMGVGDNFCWIWHKNAIGQVAEGIRDLFG